MTCLKFKFRFVGLQSLCFSRIPHCPKTKNKSTVGRIILPYTQFSLSVPALRSLCMCQSRDAYCQRIQSEEGRGKHARLGQEDIMRKKRLRRWCQNQQGRRREFLILFSTSFKDLTACNLMGERGINTFNTTKWDRGERSVLAGVGG